MLGNEDHRELAKSLQTSIQDLRRKLQKSIDDAWVDRETILEGVVESGGMGLDGGAGLDKAREAVKGTVAEWKGLGVLAT